jgi:hypothetical protein
MLFYAVDVRLRHGMARHRSVSDGRRVNSGPSVDDWFIRLGFRPIAVVDNLAVLAADDLQRCTPVTRAGGFGLPR